MAAGLSTIGPGGVWIQALAVGTGRQVGRQWARLPLHRLTLIGIGDLAAAPKDHRPADLAAGRLLLAGRFVLAGQTVDVGDGGDPWDRPSPSLQFAAALHRMDWLRDLEATGPEGAVAALRLTLSWSRLFGRGNRFSWRGDILPRRVFNLACAADLICARASDLERGRILRDLARQAQALLLVSEGTGQAASRAVAAGVAGAALSGPAGGGLLRSALGRLERLLPLAVAADGGHATRSPEAALDLLLDLMTLDAALSERGMETPRSLLRTIDRLTGSVRFFTLADGMLADMQGGGAGREGQVAAALGGQAGKPPVARNGYQRLDGRGLQVLVDAAAPAQGAWSLAACAQPLAITVLSGDRRLIVGCAWTPVSGAPQALRMVDGASTLSVGDQACGGPLRGLRAAGLGPRLVDAYQAVEQRRHEADGALWLELSHDGWVKGFQLRHERRLYLDVAADELRGEDCLSPCGDIVAGAGSRFVPFTVRFHLHPDVTASLALDGHSVLLKVEGQDTAWWLRNDAKEVALEPSVYIQDGQPRRTMQVVLRGQARLDAGAKVRWKLTAAEAGAAAPKEAIDRRVSAA